MKLKTQLDIVKYSLYVKKLSARWRPGGVLPSVNVGPPNISESKGARKLKLKTPLASGTKNFPLGAYRGYRAP